MALTNSEKHARFHESDELERIASTPIETWSKMVSHNHAGLWFEEWNENFVHLELRGSSTGHEIRAECDDACEHRFHSRDWTSSGLPFVSDEPYWSGFWFESLDDAKQFCERYRHHGAIGFWEPEYDEILDKRRQRRSHH